MRKINKLPLPLSTQRQIDAKISTGKAYIDLTTKQCKSIRRKLLESQKYLCCYCERQISKDCHIEHFYEQDDYTIHGIHSLDYAQNLIASCEGDKDPTDKKDETPAERIYRQENTSCGHRKGKAYHQNISVDYTLLLNPQNDISHLFSYASGYISANNSCTAIEKMQVDYTIKRLALDSDKLNRMRIKSIEELQRTLPSNLQELTIYLQEIFDETQEELSQYFSTLKENFAFLLS